MTIQEDITARKESELRIEYLAHHDTLTGLANRIIFQDFLTRSLEQARRRGRMLALHLLDLDRFKVVNDTLGHDAGDSLLKVVADRLRTCIARDRPGGPTGGRRIRDHPDRAGGDRRGGQLARRILGELERPMVVDGREFHMTASIGIMLFPADDASTEQFVKNADLAMYRAKSEGRNTFQFYSREMNAAVEERMSLENSLRAALAGQEFVLHYQPLLELEGRSDHRRGSPRALAPSPARLDHALPVHPDRRRQRLDRPPGPLGVVPGCCAETGLAGGRLAPARIHVNVSTVQFKRDDVISTVSQVLAREQPLPRQPRAGGDREPVGFRYPGHRGGPSSPEPARASSSASTTSERATRRSATSPISPSIGSRSTRRSSRASVTNSKDTAIVRAIIGMGHALGMRVVAEGVETAEQRSLLTAEGCDEIQGYLINRAMPPEQMAGFLRSYTDRVPIAAESVLDLTESSSGW